MNDRHHADLHEAITTAYADCYKPSTKRSYVAAQKALDKWFYLIRKKRESTRRNLKKIKALHAKTLALSKIDEDSDRYDQAQRLLGQVFELERFYKFLKELS
jgi:hypothetical protein